MGLSEKGVVKTTLKSGSKRPEPSPPQPIETLAFS
jgi:hypothetical protein